jgi:hypothetical protein
LLSLLLFDAKKKQNQSQDVENVDILPGTCFFKMPSASPARSTSVEYVESVPGTDDPLHDPSDAISSGICMDSLLPYRTATI